MLTLVTLGTDSSGRPIRATPYEAQWIAAFAKACKTKCPEPFEPVIVQGPWQGSHGAAASADTHNEAGCIDYRTWNLSPVQKQFLIREARRMGCAMYLRTPPAFDEHAHGIIGQAEPKSIGAGAQWQAYLRGEDGLAGDGDDYHWRPTPLVTTWAPPEWTRGERVDHAIDDITERRQAAKDPVVRRTLRQAKEKLKTLPRWVKR